MSYRDHAIRELIALGYSVGSNKKEDMNSMVVDNILELLDVFSNQGHSGFSAPYVAELFKKLALFEPLSPLTGEDSEWQPCSFGNGYQNIRASHVFKDEDGRAYDVHGKVFRDKNGSCFTSGDSRVYITFPYTPTTEYIDVDE